MSVSVCVCVYWCGCGCGSVYEFVCGEGGGAYNSLECEEQEEAP